MKLEKAISNTDYQLCFLLNPENDSEKELLSLVDFTKTYYCWHDGRVALRTNLMLVKGE